MSNDLEPDCLAMVVRPAGSNFARHCPLVVKCVFPSSQLALSFGDCWEVDQLMPWVSVDGPIRKPFWPTNLLYRIDGYDEEDTKNEPVHHVTSE
tara:strand:+ start:956 stop:1237 length:282 start_codon:yes stop_codon:yes gene_type:complete